jgi:endonuclease III
MCELDQKTRVLLDLKKRMINDVLFPVLEEEARQWVPSSPYAFCLAICLDRCTKAEIIWTIPYWLSNLTGHLDPQKFNQMTLLQLADLINKLPKKPRFSSAASKTISSLTRIIVEQFDGSAENIWREKSAQKVKETFRQVYGVGVGISNLSVILLEQAYKFSFSDLDHTCMDIKPDVHTKRVLYRLGFSLNQDDTSAINAARSMNPDYPGELDGPLWYIGKTWCNSFHPNCNDCELFRAPCPRIGLP